MKKVREERLLRIAVLEELHFHPLGRAFGNYIKAQQRLTGIDSNWQQHHHQAFNSDSNVFISAALPES